MRELTVVVADDEAELLGAVCQLVNWEALGFRLVGRAGNGLDALQLVEALQPDFLLTDIRMPFISGTALAHQARAVQPLLQVAFLSGYDDFEYARAGIEDEIVAYLLKPISMAELTEELRKIHTKIEKRLSALTERRSGTEQTQVIAATLMLDDYLKKDVAAAAEQLREAGVALGMENAIMVAAMRAPGVRAQEILTMATEAFSRAFACCGFCSGERAMMLLSSGEGFERLYLSLDEVRQGASRLCGAELAVGLSKEFPSAADGHAAYLEAMEALELAERGDGLYATGGWNDMAVLCGRAMKMIEKEYMDEALSLQLASERLHISPNYLGANIKKYAGDTFMNLLIRKRMEVARNLLENGPSRVAEVARRCGYADQSYFGYCFKKYYGVSPAKMRAGAAHGEADG